MARHESSGSLDDLLAQVPACRACEAHLPLGPRPVVQAGAAARILVVGQAPGARVHASGIPWGDCSGARLREWMGIDAEHFYDPARVAIVPMGFSPRNIAWFKANPWFDDELLPVLRQSARKLIGG